MVFLYLVFTLAGAVTITRGFMRLIQALDE